jgi:hypothetical protein
VLVLSRSLRRERRYRPFYEPVLTGADANTARTEPMIVCSRIFRRTVVVATIVCAVLAAAQFRVLLRSTDHFLTCSQDARVHFEPGAEKLAGTVAMALPEAIATVERQQYGSFAKPITIYVCASVESIANFGGPKSAGGFVLNGRLFISPKPQNTAERIPRLLAHELSHLHSEQRLGMAGYALKVPSWFKEGLAVVVSSGGGAETVSDVEGKSAIAEGRTFTPTMSGRPMFEKSGRSYGLTEHMWYRQSALLVQFLRDRDETAFKRLMSLLDQGSNFKSALKTSYAESIDVLLKDFRATAAPGQAVKG